MIRLTDRPDMTFDVYRGRKTTIQQRHNTFTMSANLNKTASAFHLLDCLLAIKSSNNA